MRCDFVAVEREQPFPYGAVRVKTRRCRNAASDAFRSTADGRITRRCLAHSLAGDPAWERVGLWEGEG